MGNLFAEIISKLMVLITILFGIVVFFSLVNNIFKSKLINKVVSLVGYTLFIVFAFFILIFFIGIFVFTFMIVNSILLILIRIFAIESIAVYLALTITLIILAYLPEYLGFYLLKFLSYTTNYENNLSNLYNNFIKLVRPKMLMYIVAFLLSVTSSIEKISHMNLINLEYWSVISNYVLEAIVTFLAFDTIMTYINDNKNEILKDIKKIIDSINSLKKEEH